MSQQKRDLLVMQGELVKMLRDNRSWHSMVQIGMSLIHIRNIYDIMKRESESQIQGTCQSDLLKPEVSPNEG